MYLNISRHRFNDRKYPFTGSANASPVNSICDHQISNWCREIVKYNTVIFTLNVDKAVEHDIISNRMLLAVKNEITKPLSMLFNRSLQEMVFPDHWKVAHVIALFKKGDKSLPSNYRPVSLLSCVSKILEKIVYKHMYNHLHIKKLVYKSSRVFCQNIQLPIS